MTQEQLSRLGEPYYTTKGIAGTGLGMMTGKLNVNSEVNKGTTFYISFPLMEKELIECKQLHITML